MDAKNHLSGIVIHAQKIEDTIHAMHGLAQYAEALRIDPFIESAQNDSNQYVRFCLNEAFRREFLSDWDTLGFIDRLQLAPNDTIDKLELEIFVALLAGPVVFHFPSLNELMASIRIRKNIVKAARCTVLSFHTEKIERPVDYWCYSEDNGFTVLQGKSLIDALIQATQPGVSGGPYSFSCYRATEYVILLGIALELANNNIELFNKLQRQWELKAIQSRKFHDTFLYEYGSHSEPLPVRYFVPGDRVWFRNPDKPSSDVTGYEGSWVIYMGGGFFSNFWNPDQPYTLDAKCVEIYHWRDGFEIGSDGTMKINEALVSKKIRATMDNPEALKQILHVMMRMRDTAGVYANGGCLDASREYPRCVCPGSANIPLP